MNRIASKLSRRLRPCGVALLILAGLTALGGCRQKPPDAEAAAVPLNVRTLTLQPTAVTEYFEVTGPVEPVVGTLVHSEESGNVVAVVHDRGDRVVAGDVLVEIDRRLLRAEMEANRAALALAEYDAEKTRELFAAAKVSRLELLAAEQKHAAAKAAAEIAEIRHGRAAVRAPFAGLVADRLVEPGQLVGAGTPVARVIDPYTLKLTGSLTERDVAWIQEGAPALVQMDGHAGLVTGRVHWVGFEADPASGKFKVEIRLDNRDLALRGGVVGRARLQKARHPDAVAIPRDAVVQGPDGDSVFVVEQEHARLQAVDLGDAQGLMVTVRRGLQPGQQLVVRGQRDLADGSLVRITEEAESADGAAGGDPAVVTGPEAGPRVQEPREGAR